MEWFVLVDTETGAKTVQKGLSRSDEGAVGPYATMAEAAEWAGLCTRCAGTGRAWFPNGGPWGIGRDGKCDAPAHRVDVGED